LQTGCHAYHIKIEADNYISVFAMVVYEICGRYSRVIEKPLFVAHEKIINSVPFSSLMKGTVQVLTLR